jgi:septation ring formation regulator EzrA
MTALEAAVRLARVLALNSLRDAPVQLDVHEVADALRDIAGELQRVQSMKSKLTSIGSVAREVSTTLDEMRAGVQRHLRRVEDQLRAVESEQPNALSA